MYLRGLGTKLSRDRMWENGTNLARIGLVDGFVALALLAVQLETRYERDSAWLIADTGWGNFLAAVLISIGPELAGIGIGIVTIDYLNERRQDEQIREQLALQMGSGHSDVADTAVRGLAARGWLYDGSLKRAWLGSANLQGAALSDAFLQESHLEHANLEAAVLSGANLRAAILAQANLQRTVLNNANLQKAVLMSASLKRASAVGANFQNAYLHAADLQAASLYGANLRDAYLHGTNLADADMEKANVTPEQHCHAASLEGATMPDGVILLDRVTRTALHSKLGGTASQTHNLWAA